MASPLFPVAIAFSLGILISSWVHTSLVMLMAAASVCLFLSWISYCLKKAILTLSISFTTFVLLGVLWPHLHSAGKPPYCLSNLILNRKIDLNEPCRVTGVCLKGSISRGIGEQIELDVERIENRFSSFFTQGKVRLALYYQKNEVPPPKPLINPGDRVEVLTNLRAPRNFGDPGQFDYVAYLNRQDVALVGIVKNELLITRLSVDQGNLFSRLIYKTRRALFNRIEGIFSQSTEIQAAFKALLLGDKQGLSKKVEENFQATGIYHILVISGQHVAIMAVFLLGLFKACRFPRGLTIGLTLLGLAFFTAITEGQSSIVRATLMATGFLLTVQFDRDRNLLNSLSLAALALLWIDPFWLFDPGFQLSFISVLAIALIAIPLLRLMTQPWREALRQVEDEGWDAHCLPRLADFRIWLRIKIAGVKETLIPSALCTRTILLPFQLLLSLTEILIVSFSIQLVFIVLMIIYFHRISAIALFLNILVVPLVGLIVPIGFLLLLFAFLFPPVSPVLAGLCALLVSLLLRLAEFFSGTAWGNYRLPTPPFWLVIAYFLALSLTLLPNLGRLWRGFALGCALLTLVVLIVQPFSPRLALNLLQLTVLDVRQGDSIFVSMPDQSTLMIDGGGLLGHGFGEQFTEEGFDVGEQVVSPYLWSLGVKRLDAVVLTHAHHDHMSGLYAVLNNFQVGELWVGENPYLPEYLKLIKSALQKSIRIRHFEAGDKLVFHSAFLEFLNPFKESQPGPMPKNNDSLAFRLKYSDRSFLLTGDIEKKIESQILDRNAAIRSDILKVAHHGSRSSTSLEFLNRVSPILAIISVAEHSPFGHPHPEVIARLKEKSIPVLRTDRDGAVTITTDGRQLDVTVFQTPGER